MSRSHQIEEYIDPDSGRRLVSVSFDESGKAKSLVVPFDLLADDLLGFLADAAHLYPEEVFLGDGFRKFERLVFDHASPPKNG